MVQTIQLFIKANSKKGPLVEKQEDGVLVVFVREPAVEGKANKAVIELIAEYYDVPKSHVQIKSGLTARHKTIVIAG